MCNCEPIIRDYTTAQILALEASDVPQRNLLQDVALMNAGNATTIARHLHTQIVHVFRYARDYHYVGGFYEGCDERRIMEEIYYNGYGIRQHAYSTFASRRLNNAYTLPKTPQRLLYDNCLPLQPSGSCYRCARRTVSVRRWVF